MNIVVLSGGSGSRLWPLSNGVRSKQFLKIFEKPDGTKESMAQRMCRMIGEIDDEAKIVVATSENQVPQIRSQLGEDVSISVEPCRRDTFPAIVLACAYLAKEGTKRDEPVIICPVDPYVDSDYFECLLKMSKAAEAGNANITLMGIEPTYPATQYGYIIPNNSDAISEVKEFKEKPDEETAKQYLKQGALWNGGVFAVKLGYVLDVAEREFGTSEYIKLHEKYAELKKISFDYAVVEKESKISVVRFNGQWKDIGTWDTFSEVLSEQASGNSTVANCENTLVVNETQLPLIALGIKGAIVAATPDGILVSDKSQVAQLKELVPDERPMYEKRLWGEYKVLDCSEKEDGTQILVKELIIKPGKNISYQYHTKRSEIWTITQGEGELIIDDEIKVVCAGDCIKIAPLMKHAIKAKTELHIIEVQMGTELVEEDIIRLKYEF